MCDKFAIGVWRGWARNKITGEEGDVFIGAAMNLIYAQVDIIEIDENVIHTSIYDKRDHFTSNYYNNNNTFSSPTL